MKKSISIWSFPQDWTLEKKMRLAREAGFEGFEIDLTEDGPVGMNSSLADLLAAKKLSDQIGISLSGLASGLFWGANACSADPAVREKAAAILVREIECAEALGVNAVLVIPGAVGVDFLPGSEVVPYAQACERAKTFIEEALPRAERAGVTLCIENVWNKLFLSPLEMRDFIEGFDSRFVASYFDVGNTLATGYPEHWIPILGHRIRRVHFKDFRRAVGSIDGFCDLLSGDVNWPAVVGALRTAGYTGWVAAEMIPPVPFYKHCPEVLIQNTSRALDAILAL